MSIWEAFGKGRYKGFSREAGLLLDEAVELAGGLGKKADTGHLLLAMLQTDHGPAAKFLAGKNISELAVRRQLGADREGPALHLDRKALAPDLKRAMDYALIGAQNAHLAQSGTGAPALRHVGGYRLRGRGAAGFHGGPACGGGAGMPPAVRPVHPASAASRGFGHAAGQPRQR